MSGKFRLTAASALLVVLGLTGCTSTVNGSATPDGQAGQPPAPTNSAPAPAALPYQNGFQPFLDSLNKMRTWDPCALHDVDAAQTAIGGTAQYIVPIAELNRCRLNVRNANGQHSWSIDASLEIEMSLRNSYGKGEVDGVTSYKKLPPKGNGPQLGNPCAYFLPLPSLTEPAGIKLELNTTEMGVSMDVACEKGLNYFRAVLSKWQNPTLVADNVTSPKLSLYGKDPCLALQPAVLAKPNVPGEKERYVSGVTPYTCEYTSGTLGMVAKVTMASVREDEQKSTQLGSSPAVVKQSAGECEYRVPIDPAIKFTGPAEPGMQPGVFIKLAGCDTTLASQILDATLNQPALPDQPSGNAGSAKRIALGKLN